MLNKNKLLVLNKNYAKTDENFYNFGLLKENVSNENYIELLKNNFVKDITKDLQDKESFNTIYDYYNNIYLQGNVSKTLAEKISKKNNIKLFVKKYVSQVDGFRKYILQIPDKYFDNKSISKELYLDLISSSLPDNEKANIISTINDIKNIKERIKKTILGNIFFLIIILVGGLGVGYLGNILAKNLYQIFGTMIFSFSKFLWMYSPLLLFLFLIIYFLINFKKHNIFLYNLFLKLGFKNFRPFANLVKNSLLFNLFVFIIVNSSLNRNISIVKLNFKKEFDFLKITEQELGNVNNLDDLINLILTNDERLKYFLDGSIDILELNTSLSQSDLREKIKSVVDKMIDGLNDYLENFKTTMKNFTLVLGGIIISFLFPLLNGFVTLIQKKLGG